MRLYHLKSKIHNLFFLFLTLSYLSVTFTTSNSTQHTPLSLFSISDLERLVYSSTFRLRDGSELSETSQVAVSSMSRNARRLLSIPTNIPLPNATRALSDTEAIKLLFLAVAGNFVVDHSESAALPQRCSLVVDPGTGGLVLRDASSTQSVILEVLVIVSIICLLRAWDGLKG